MTKQIEAAALHRLLTSDGEIAPIDVREDEAFAAGHLLLARLVPVGRIDLVMDALVPRRATPIVLMDAGDGLAERAVQPLEGLGYSDIAILAGGVAAWKAAGYELFSGTNVPSKAFGELVEHRHHTPSISAEELRALKDKGTDLVILDSRPVPRIPAHVDPRRDRLPGRRAGLSRARPGPAARNAGGGQLRRADAQHHRRAVADQRRHPQQGGGAAQRHDGLAARRLRGGARR